MRGNKQLVLGSLLLSLIAYATSESEMLLDLAACWDKSDELMGQVQPDDMGETAHDPKYIEKKKNDQRCYAIQRNITKKYSKEYACFYQHQSKSRQCKESIGGWR